MKALFLNCTLKKSPETSNTRALCDQVKAELEQLGVECEILRPVDYNIPHGTAADMGEGDEWPQILQKIKACDIFIMASPVWMGARGSVCTLVMNRLNGSLSDTDPENGQYILYNKVAGCVVTGNEDGAKNVCMSTLFDLNDLGATIPPNASTYWVGKAGAGPSYIEAGGEKHLFTNRTLRFLAHNCHYMARLLRANPIAVNLKKLEEDAKKVSEEG